MSKKPATSENADTTEENEEPEVAEVAERDGAPHSGGEAASEEVAGKADTGGTEDTEDTEDTDNEAAAEQPRWRRLLVHGRRRVETLPRRFTIGLVVLLVAGCAAGGWWWTQRGLPDDVAFRIGEQDVSVAALEERMATVGALYGVEQPEGGEALEEFWRDAAQSMAVGLVLDELAADEGVSVSEQRVEQALGEYVTAFFGEGDAGRQAYSLALSNSGASEVTVTDEVRRQLVVNDLYSVVTVDAESVSDADLTSEYAARECELTVPEKRRLLNVVVADEDTAAAVLAQLNQGADFSTVAQASSLDAASKESGGDIGTLARADLEQAYGDAAFGVGEGEFFGPVQSQYGWNVGQVAEVTPSRLPALSEITDALRNTVFAERQAEVWKDWLGEKLRAADVEYADRYRPDDPYALPDSTTGASEESTSGC